MTRLQEIGQPYQFHRWAHRRMLEAVATLTDEQLARDLGSSFPSVRDTLVHVLSAEWVAYPLARVVPVRVPAGVEAARPA